MKEVLRDIPKERRSRKHADMCSHHMKYPLMQDSLNDCIRGLYYAANRLEGCSGNAKRRSTWNSKGIAAHGNCALILCFLGNSYHFGMETGGTVCYNMIIIEKKAIERQL